MDLLVELVELTDEARAGYFLKQEHQCIVLVHPDEETGEIFMKYNFKQICFKPQSDTV